MPDESGLECTCVLWPQRDPRGSHARGRRDGGRALQLPDIRIQADSGGSTDTHTRTHKHTRTHALTHMHTHTITNANHYKFE